MENGKETVADILEKMSECAEMRDFDSDGMLSTSILRVFADHIHAAYGREVAELRAKAESEELWANLCQESAKNAKEELRNLKDAQEGDAAKMREALSDACYAMFNFLKTQNGSYEEMANALDKAKAALAAPPRNCDKYATLEKAEEAYENQSGSLEDGHAFGWWLLNAEGEATGEARR